MTMPDGARARYEAEVLRHVWETWRGDRNSEFEGAHVHSVALRDEGDRVGVEVCFHIVRQVGHPEHRVRRLVAWPPEDSPEGLADDIVYSVWAEANGTA